jgi:protein ImuB
MVERIRWQLEGWVRQPGGLTGGVVLLRLTPVEIKPDVGRQLGFWGGRTQADEWAHRAITRLGGLLGVEAVTVPVWRGGREPARQYELLPAVDHLDVECAPTGRSTASQKHPPWPGQLPRPSPAHLFVPAEPCTVEDLRGVNVTVSGRGFVSNPPAVLGRGPHRFQVASWAGPWPIEERWWEAGGRRCARFQLVTDEGVAYLAAVETGRWWLNAMYF